MLYIFYPFVVTIKVYKPLVPVLRVCWLNPSLPLALIDYRVSHQLETQWKLFGAFAEAPAPTSLFRAFAVGSLTQARTHHDTCKRSALPRSCWWPLQCHLHPNPCSLGDGFKPRTVRIRFDQILDACLLCCVSTFWMGLKTLT